MKKLTKALAALMLMVAVVFAAGCSKTDEPNNGNNNGNGGGNNGGGGGDVVTTVPVVKTSAVSEITQTNALGGGTITSDGGSAVTECGVCWGTAADPTVSGNHAVSASNTGTFTCPITNLEPNTAYHVRAYAKNSVGTSYGNEVTFTTLPNGGGGGGVNAPEGAIGGLYSVSATRQVFFSQGNLQYKASTQTWRFAEHQYDIAGESNNGISPTYDGWIDLFGWGTSGYNGKVPYMTSTNWHDYYDGDFDIAGTNYDWGVYNAISNGGNLPGLWRTLTGLEWTYVLFERETPSGIRFVKGQVNHLEGVILLPDEWSASTYNLDKINNTTASFVNNNISQSDWQNILEPAGAVFLPAAGNRYDNYAASWGYMGGYFSSSKGSEGWYCTCIYMDSSYFRIGDKGNRHSGTSVRLVRDAE